MDLVRRKDAEHLARRIRDAKALCKVVAASAECRSKENSQTTLTVMFGPIQEGSNRFCEVICPVDETWVHHYTPETKQQSKNVIIYATSLVEIPGKFKTALRRSFRLQGLQPQYGFEDLPSSTKMVTTEASGTSEVFGENSGQQSCAYHIPRNPPTFSGGNAQDPQKWIKMFERVAKYNKWDETQSLANVVFYLEGTAAQWFDNNEDTINAWT
ncbi:hypothetical protein LAZ67_7001923 [Cordylochernes scorpioides]|uniref:Retrotransposon gag domain-containing protein n=1 Tax=Cordylochernes scorpioides TaxID=51811 RepID=A0ABY6KP93_9ARAC|nr:hypothetical protein LAZ67_7001923 [Cordylochernes scorpioides]